MGDWAEGDRVVPAAGRPCLMLDVAFDAVGIKATFEQALAMLGTRGRLVGVEMSAGEVSLGSTMLFGLPRKQVRGHLGYEVADVEILARLVSTGRLDLSRFLDVLLRLRRRLAAILTRRPSAVGLPGGAVPRYRALRTHRGAH